MNISVYGFGRPDSFGIKKTSSATSISYSGNVVTPYGIVDVCSYYEAGGAYRSTLMTMALAHNVYEWQEDAFYQPRYLTTLAQRFAAQVAKMDTEEVPA